MKKVIALLALVLSSSAFASEVTLFANINVTQSSTVTSSDANGGYDVDTYNSEDTYVIGSIAIAGNLQQIVARVAGCDLFNSKNLLLRVSNKANKYDGYFGQTTYKLTVSSKNECQALQRAMRSATQANQTHLNLDDKTSTFTVVQ